MINTITRNKVQQVTKNIININIILQVMAGLFQSSNVNGILISILAPIECGNLYQNLLKLNIAFLSLFRETREVYQFKGKTIDLSVFFEIKINY